MIQSGGIQSFGCWSGNVGKRERKTISISLARDNLHRLVSNVTSNAINKLKKKKKWKRSGESSKKIYFIYLKWRYEW